MFSRHRDRAFGGGVAVLGIHDLIRPEVNLRLLRRSTYLTFGTDQDGYDESALEASTAASSETVSTGCTTAVRMGVSPRVSAMSCR